MKIDKTIDRVKGLIDGTNKETGEVLFDPEENKSVNQALEKSLEILEKEKDRIIKRNNKPTRNGESWTDEEDNTLVEEFNSYKNTDMSFSKFKKNTAKAHKRTKGSIDSRIEKLARSGRIEY